MTRPPDTPADTPAHTATYPYPRTLACLKRAADLDFWDVLYALADPSAPTLTVRARQFAALARGPDRYAAGRKLFSRWHTFARAGLLRETTPPSALVLTPDPDGELVGRYYGEDPVYRFVLRPDVAGPAAIQKPRGYVQHGWLRVLHRALHKQLLNLLLAHPGPDRWWTVESLLDAFSTALGAWRPPPGCTTLSLGRLSRAELAAAVRHLASLGLVRYATPTPGARRAFSLDPAPLDRPPPADALAGQPPAAALTPLQDDDPARADAALACLAAGGLPAHLLHRVFRDLSQVGPAARPDLLRQLARLHHLEPKTRWDVALARALERQRRRPATLTSAWVRLSLHAPLAERLVSIDLPPTLRARDIAHAALEVAYDVAPARARLGIPERVTVTVRLLAAEAPGHDWRWSLTADALDPRPVPAPDLTGPIRRGLRARPWVLRVEADRPCPWLTLRARLHLEMAAPGAPARRRHHRR